MTAPVASGWSGCRVGLTPTGKRRLSTAHTQSRLWSSQNPALQQAPDLMLANPLCCHAKLGAADAFRSAQTARVHHGTGWRGGVAADGAHTVEQCAGDRDS